MRDRSQIGELRPSQLMHTYGVGATVELPELTTLVLGLDDWPRALGEPSNFGFYNNAGQFVVEPGTVDVSMNVTVRDCPGARVTRWKPASLRTGWRMLVSLSWM
jgi:hypothetical protein